MDITIEIVDKNTVDSIFKEAFLYFKYVDKKFSTYIPDSEINLINRGLMKKVNYSKDMKKVFSLSKETKKLTGGYFDIHTPSGKIDPSGLVKGWSIYNVSKLLKEKGLKNFYIDAGGDIQVSGKNREGNSWRVGIRNPLNFENEIIKVVSLSTEGLATSGTYAKGQHIYNPHNKKEVFKDILSLSVIGPNVYEADRFATSAFAMGRKGINFIEKLEGFEGYMVDKNGVAIMTTNFKKYVKC